MYLFGVVNLTIFKEGKMDFNKKWMRVLVCMVMFSFVFAVGIATAADNITGTIEKTEAGSIIKAEDGDYLVSGQDLSAMAGKKVKATGTISETKEGKTINVESVEEIE